MDPLPYPGETLPAELVYDIILDLFAQYLHHALTGAEHPTWNAFVVIPSVSRVFHSLSQPLFRRIFGENDVESVDLVARERRYATSKACWARTRLLPCPQWDPDLEGFSPEEIPRPYKALSQPSVLAVYDLVARGRYFFNSKAMHIEDEETMCSLRLWCPFMGQALRICDEIFPRRLLSFIGPHVVEQTTYCYSLECVDGVKNAIDNLLKPPQWLNYFSTESYVSQNLTSLKTLEENRWHFLWLGGYISNTYDMCITPSSEMLQTTKILETLSMVMMHDWRDDPNDIGGRAEDLHKMYTARIKEHKS
ncbi:hypothetical protein K439DRAFT_498269 [Ramaria rubella]|nr:hypothetical protein K439DRAFT_498269 [Ramaria rubella]